jgi:hypothetical protein
LDWGERSVVGDAIVQVRTDEGLVGIAPTSPLGPGLSIELDGGALARYRADG